MHDIPERHGFRGRRGFLALLLRGAMGRDASTCVVECLDPAPSLFRGLFERIRQAPDSLRVRLRARQEDLESREVRMLSRGVLEHDEVAL